MDPEGHWVNLNCRCQTGRTRATRPTLLHGTWQTTQTHKLLPRNTTHSQDVMKLINSGVSRLSTNGNKNGKFLNGTNRARCHVFCSDLNINKIGTSYCVAVFSYVYFSTKIFWCWPKMQIYFILLQVHTKWASMWTMQLHRCLARSNLKLV